jgi:hypothetical protein
VLPTESEHSRHLRDVVCNHLSLPALTRWLTTSRNCPTSPKWHPQPSSPPSSQCNPSSPSSFSTHYCKQGRIFPDQRTRVYLPMPEGLLRVRTARNGDTGYDFDTARHASVFNDSIMALGRVFQSTTSNPGWDRSVYLGKQLR